MYREKAHVLRRAMIAVGVPYKCGECSQLPVWNGQPLTLDVDHVNGDWHDDRIENLRSLCPNCHTQQETSKPCRVAS